MRRKNRSTRGLFISINLLAFMFLSACSSGSSTGGGQETTITTPTAFDAWNSPCGNPIQGATLSDGWTNLCQVPTPVLVSGGWTDSAAITANGLSLYFGYSTIDFGKFEDSSGATQTPSGPTRSGMTGTAFKMFRADLSSSGWTVNFLPFNGSATVNEASASPNNAQDTVVFSRFNTNGVGTLFYTTLSSGTWSTPAALPTSPAINTTNTSCTNDNGFIIGSFSTGFTLYFESNRNDIAGTTCRADAKNRLYYATYNSVTGFSTPQEVPGLDGGLTSENDTQISLTTDAHTVYFTRATNAVYGVFTAAWNGNSFTNVHQIVMPNFTPPYTGKLVNVGEANVAITTEGQILYMMCGVAQTETLSQDPAIGVCFAKKPN